MGKAPTEDVIRALTLLCHQPVPQSSESRTRRLKYPPIDGWFLPSDLARSQNISNPNYVSDLNPDQKKREEDEVKFPEDFPKSRERYEKNCTPEMEALIRPLLEESPFFWNKEPERLPKACEDGSTPRLCARLEALGVTERSRDGRFIRLRRDPKGLSIIEQFIVSATAHARFYNTKKEQKMTAMLSRHYRKYFVPKTRSAQEGERERKNLGIKVLKRKYAEFLIEYQTSPESVQTAFKDIMSNETIPGEVVVAWLDGPRPIQEEALINNLETKKEADRRRKRKS